MDEKRYLVDENGFEPYSARGSLGDLGPSGNQIIIDRKMIIFIVIPISYKLIFNKLTKKSVI
jgi:hypothetical protein